jgi:cyclic pyranopterin phosphate synthase
VRPGIVSFLERINNIPGLEEIVLTTNGILLEKMAEALHKSGVKRLNISLDSLKPETFAAITGGGNLDHVLAGIDAASRAGFPPPQINVVVLRGVNDEEIYDFASMAIDRDLTVRFIEYMPINGDSNWNSFYVNSDEILMLMSRRHRLTPLERTQGAGPARYFQLDHSSARIGVISPISKHFCASCNRIRITADGLARGCLFSQDVTDLKPYLSRDDEALSEILKSIIREKPFKHNLPEGLHGSRLISMSAIGG